MGYVGDRAEDRVPGLIELLSSGRTEPASLTREHVEVLIEQADRPRMQRLFGPPPIRPGLLVPDWQLECQPRVEQVPFHGPGGTCGMATVVTSSFPMVERAVRFGGHTVPLFFRP